jgi:hypothetical protein
MPIARRSIKLLRQPYFWLFHVMTIAACRAVHAIERTEERFEAVFDEQEKFGPRAREWYPLILDLLESARRALAPVTATSLREASPVLLAQPPVIQSLRASRLISP